MQRKRAEICAAKRKKRRFFSSFGGEGETMNHFIRAAVTAAAVFLCSAAVSAAETARLTEEERQFTASVIAAECEGEPLAARVAIVGLMIDRCRDGGDCAADEIRALEAQGVFSGAMTEADRLSLDAVDAAIGGSRPAGNVTEVRRVKKEKPRLDFEDGEAVDGVVIGGFVFR